MEELRLIDDERYAGLVARHYASKGYGLLRIREELYRRGVRAMLAVGPRGPEDAG
jgi:SOS response regulatory protein OraA/RecX